MTYILIIYIYIIFTNKFNLHIYNFTNVLGDECVYFYYNIYIYINNNNLCYNIIFFKFLKYIKFYYYLY